MRPRLECDFFNHYLKKSRFRVRKVRAGQEFVTLYNIFYKDIIFRDVTYNKGLYLMDHLPCSRMVVSRTVVKK